MVEYVNIHKTFDVPVLRGVDLTVNTGETLSIVGPSGTGKSVLLKTTIGLITPDVGDVRIDGESVFFGGPGTLREVRKKVGYVFQNAALFDSMTVYENVATGIPEDELKTLARRVAVSRVADALEHVNLDPRVVMNKLPAELSGGMRKRVGLARASVGHPRILLYDEPVTGLDPVNSALVHRLIHQLDRDLDATSIVVTHEVEGALAISDRVALLEGGLVRFVGTPDEFRNSQEPMVRAFIDRDAAMRAAEEMASAEMMETA
jgi:phospholipid/cholesterol/gamma-HCH transport system ATP-binding protein